MHVEVNTTKNKLDDYIHELTGLNNKTIEVGAFEGENAWLAHIHEFGCQITPKNAQYLTVPVHPKAKGKKAKDFPDLFYLEAKSGEKFLAREVGENNLEVLFWLTQSVVIPERSFIRAGHDQYVNAVLKQSNLAINSLLSGKISIEKTLDLIGQQITTKIKKFARDLNSPPNKWSTTEAKGSDNPLVDTGNMIESITWRIK